ncbi:MAG: amidohydrolase [Chloroflexota bacterium]|nr:amidohydrolase [Chloroflexota bacterium]
MSPDQILVNGRIHTLAPENSIVTALAVTRNAISAIGSDSEILQLASNNTHVINLQDRLVIPGMVDAHCHFDHFSRQVNNVDAGQSNKRELIKILANQTKITPEEQWITGHGWDHNRWGEDVPTASDIDVVAPNHPVFLTGHSMHISWANSSAMTKAHINTSTPDPAGGIIGRDEHGNPNGIFYETASDLIVSVMPELSIYDVANNMLLAQEKLWKTGLTGLHDYDHQISFNALELLSENDTLGLRVVKNMPASLLDEVIATGYRTGSGDKWLRIGGIKVFMDGALGARTASMLEPYELDTNNYGIVVTEEDELLSIADKSNTNGLAMTVHAIGDRANREVLNVYEKLRQNEMERGDPPSKLRHRIEHVQLLHPNDYLRLASSQIIASMQPIHATADMTLAEKYWGDRISGAYAWRTQIDAGAILAFGSDAPVESINPLWGIHAAVTRSNRTNNVGTIGWQTKQCLTVDEAVRAYTIGAAYAAYRENDLGTLAPGKLADLVVLDKDIYHCDPMDIHTTNVLGTMIDGTWKYRASDLY